ncbi:MAG: S-layer homology domain-containing protein [Fusobacteriaceae bacterium]
MKKFFLIMLSVYTLGYATISYEDIPKDHWAYNSIDTLVEKGIIQEDTYLFRGEGNIRRYDFAFYLSRILDKLELEKASKRDLDSLESLIAEFSIELTKIGYDASTFNSKLENINETIELLKNAIEENQKTIKNLEERLKKIE